MHSSQSPPLSSPSYSVEFSLSEVSHLYAELFILSRSKQDEKYIGHINSILNKVKDAIAKKGEEPELTTTIDPEIPLRAEIARLEAQLAIYEQFVEEIGKDGVRLMERLSKSIHI